MSPAFRSELASYCRVAGTVRQRIQGCFVQLITAAHMYENYRRLILRKKVPILPGGKGLRGEFSLNSPKAQSVAERLNQAAIDLAS